MRILSRLVTVIKPASDCRTQLSTSPKHIRSQSLTAKIAMNLRYHVTVGLFLMRAQPPKRPQAPQGHPPSTFLFLPIQLSNSRVDELKASASRPQPKFSETHPLPASKPANHSRLKRRRVSARRSTAASPSMAGL